MNFDDVLRQLRQERDLLDEAILKLEALAHGRKRGRGRPPIHLTESARKIPQNKTNGNGHMNSTPFSAGQRTPPTG